MELKHFNYPKEMDEECIPMCDFFNSIGLTTRYSCCGHNTEQFYILFADEIQQGDIEDFLQKISNINLLGEFNLWLRWRDGKIIGNWKYSIPLDNLDDLTPIEYSFLDLNNMYHGLNENLYTDEAAKINLKNYEEIM